MILPRLAHHLRCNLHVIQLHVVPEDNLWRLRQHRQMQLLGVAVHAHVNATGIHPSATILSRGDIIEESHHIITQIVLQMLGRCRVARLRTSPEAIEIERFLLEVEAEAMEMVVPVRILDDDLYLRIHLLRGIHNEFTPGIGHQSQTILRPTFPTPLLGGYLFIVLQIDEEEVVEDKVIEELSCIFRHLLHLLPLHRTSITVSLEVGGFRTGIGYATTHLKALREEEFLHFRHRLLVHGEGVAVGFQIDLVEIYLHTHRLPGLVEELVVGHPRHVLRPDVCRHLEVFILSCHCRQGRHYHCS